ncbi:hypothetical protein HGRIS_012103 [Hohenbuehelia grisea]|uniref:F-box domain-containing protein n=1 Tax=Hohenbuehelia grisea TaxID=104357 RepID=A0ABR3IRB1_9AGAR
MIIEFIISIWMYLVRKFTNSNFDEENPSPPRYPSELSALLAWQPIPENAMFLPTTLPAYEPSRRQYVVLTKSPKTVTTRLGGHPLVEPYRYAPPVKPHRYAPPVEEAQDRRPRDIPVTVLVHIFQYATQPRVMDSWNAQLCDIDFEGDRTVFKDYFALAQVCHQWRSVLIAHFILKAFPERGQPSPRFPQPFREPDASLIVESFGRRVSLVSTLWRLNPRDHSLSIRTSRCSQPFDTTDVVHLILDKPFDWKADNIETMTRYLSLPAPKLQLLVITGAPDTCRQYLPQKLFDGKTPQLTHLLLRSCLAPLPSTPSDPESGLQRTVKYLRIQWTDTRSSWYALYQTLRRAPELESLHLTAAIPPAGGDTDGVVRLPKLKCLVIITQAGPKDEKRLCALEKFLRDLQAPSTLDLKILRNESDHDIFFEGRVHAMIKDWHRNTKAREAQEARQAAMVFTITTFPPEASGSGLRIV